MRIRRTCHERARFGAAAVGLALLPIVVFTPTASASPHSENGWPECGAGVITKETTGVERHGPFVGQHVEVVWQNQNVLPLPVSLNTDGHVTKHYLTPHQTAREYGPARFSFEPGNNGAEQQFTWTVSATTDSSAVSLTYAVFAAKCTKSGGPTSSPDPHTPCAKQDPRHRKEPCADFPH
jgi:hypothetical protein